MEEQTQHHWKYTILQDFLDDDIQEQKEEQLILPESEKIQPMMVSPWCRQHFVTYKNHTNDCNKENRLALTSISSNNVGTYKRISLCDSSAGNRQLLISKASNNGTVINLASPREPSEMIDSIILVDPNVPGANNLFRAAQGEDSVTLHDLGANDIPALSERLAPTESEATDAGFSN